MPVLAGPIPISHPPNLDIKLHSRVKGVLGRHAEVGHVKAVNPEQLFRVGEKGDDFRMPARVEALEVIQALPHHCRVDTLEQVAALCLLKHPSQR